MAILAILDTHQGKLKKSYPEVLTYAQHLAKLFQTTIKAICFNATDSQDLAVYGADEIYNIEGENVTVFSEKLYAEIILNKFAEDHVMLLPHSTMGSGIGAYLATKKDIALITNVIGLPIQDNPLLLKRKSFSGKGIMQVSPKGNQLIITLLQNTVLPVTMQKNTSVTTITVDAINPITRKEIAASTGKINLKEAEVVVSAGRGLKAPENWGMVEELADLLQAATACSKPVADIGWRPHSEHVGQTGIAIAPNLYIAIGISGAIQHLAGVNASKKIIVINNDPDAPFFKAADYGICADAFEVLPLLNQKIKALKN